MIAETFDSVDDFERRVLGTASSSEDGNDDDDLLKQLDAIDQVSGGSASLSAGYEQDSLLYEGRASWEDDQQPTNLPIDMGFAASESFDIDDVEKPYQMRPGRFFFPGQTYLPEVRLWPTSATRAVQSIFGILMQISRHACSGCRSLISPSLRKSVNSPPPSGRKKSMRMVKF